MKEEDAKKKWCPQAFYSVDAEIGYFGNRFSAPQINKECMCIASDCAMWVEDSAHFEDSSGNTVSKHGNTENATLVVRGHCGLIHD